MKTQFLKLLGEKRTINLTDLPDLMPEIKGEYSICLPTKKGSNPNVLLLSSLSKEFIEVFNELLNKEKIIDWEPAEFTFWLIDGSPIYDLPIADFKMIKNSKKKCWLPVKIKLTQTIN